MDMICLTDLRPLVNEGRTAAVLAVCVAVRLFGQVLIAVAPAGALAGSQLHDADVIHGRVVAVLAPHATLVRGHELLALTGVALSSSNPLNVLHTDTLL